MKFGDPGAGAEDAGGIGPMKFGDPGAGGPIKDPGQPFDLELSEAWDGSVDHSMRQISSALFAFMGSSLFKTA
jgi:hypothetical protein